jgi:pseudouridine-5'-phosphate glycosidase
LVGAESVVGGPCGEGAAFVVLVAGGPEARGIHAGAPSEFGVEADFGELGAAAIPVAWVRAWLRGGAVNVGGIRQDG